MKGLFPFRNRFMLFNVTNFAKKDRVNLDYWLESDNLGDTLTPVIVNHLLSKKKIDSDKKVHGIKHLFAVGSVITAGIQDGTVWGSGILNARLGYRLKGRKLDIRSVRGPFTRTYLVIPLYLCQKYTHLLTRLKRSISTVLLCIKIK